MSIERTQELEEMESANGEESMRLVELLQDGQVQPIEELQTTSYKQGFWAGYTAADCDAKRADILYAMKDLGII